MRSLSRVSILILVLAGLVPMARADHYVADCPLSYVGSTTPTTSFSISPHGAFRNGSVIYLLRGQTLTTLNMTDSGEVDVAREDFMTSLAAQEKDGGVAYSNGYLFISSGEGLEIYDLRNVHGGAGGTAPVRISRTTGMHYRRLAVSGNVLVGVYPARDLPCNVYSPSCGNSIDIWSITNLSAPTLVYRISSDSDSAYLGFEDVAFANGYLYATGQGGTFAFDVSNPAAPVRVRVYPQTGHYLETNGTGLLAIGQEKQIGVMSVGPGPDLALYKIFTPPTIFNRANDLVFHPQAWIDNDRLVTMIDEKDPQTGQPARTIAFDAFDFSIPQFDGSDDRVYENVSMTFPDEVKYDPVMVGPFVYVTGEVSGGQVWGACGQMSGRLELDRVTALPCGGAALHGWVTGQHRVTQVELFLDKSSLGFATLGGERNDISSRTLVRSWRISVNLDEVSQGQHVIRVVATDVDGNRRQIASQTLYFPGPGDNCTARRRGLRR